MSKKVGPSGDGIHWGVYPDKLKKGDILLYYESEDSWGVATFAWYSKDGGIYTTDKGNIVDSDIVGIISKESYEDWKELNKGGTT